MPDPNYFGGKIEIADRRARTGATIPTEHAYADGNYRILGLADMAQAIRDGRPHRASGALAFHVLEVMEAFQTLVRHGRRGRDRQPPGAAGAAAGDARDRRARLKR